MKIIPFEARFDTILVRFYLMMGVAILGGFTGQMWLIAFALPLFLSAILGIKIETEQAVAKAVKMSPSVVQQKNIKNAA